MIQMQMVMECRWNDTDHRLVVFNKHVQIYSVYSIHKIELLLMGKITFILCLFGFLEQKRFNDLIL